MTKGEIQAVLFVAVSLLVGAFVLLVKQYDSDFLPDLHPVAAGGPEHGGIPTDLVAATGNAGSMRNVSSADLSDVENPGPHAVSRQTDPGYPDTGISTKSSSSFDSPLVPVNTAPASELQRLPGIGPKLAERIIAFRQQSGNFATVEQLLEVKGIGPATLDRLRPYVELR